MTIKNVLKGLTVLASIASLAACSSWGHKHAKAQSSTGSHTSIFSGDHSRQAAARTSTPTTKQRTFTAQADEGSAAVTTAYSDTANFTELARVASNDKCHAAKVIGGIEQHYYFDFDRSTVPAKDLASLKVEANYLHSHPDTKIRIEGNADDRGSREYNVALAARRANAVIEVLKQEGISKDRIQMVSYGAEKPAAFGENDEAYRCNRRVDLVFLTG